MVSHLKNVLATFGIKCVMKKMDLISAAGQLPPTECWPELWVVEDEKVVKAKAILKKTLAPLASVKKVWVCKNCDEKIEGQFSECWNCGCDPSGAQSARRGAISIPFACSPLNSSPYLFNVSRIVPATTAQLPMAVRRVTFSRSRNS